MLAGGGVWHGKELSSGESDRIRGFQLWITLPPELENGPAEPQYVEASLIPKIGPARLVLGRYQGHQSPVRAPEGVNYLMVSLQPGETFTYEPPREHDVTWLALSRGQLVESTVADEGELAVFERGQGGHRDEGRSRRRISRARIGQAPHARASHGTILGAHLEQALALGEAKIEELRKRLLTDGELSRTGAIPVQR